MTVDIQDLRERLRRMKEAGVSLYAMSIVTGSSPNTFKDFIRGYRESSAETIAAVQSIVALTPAQIAARRLRIRANQIEHNDMTTDDDYPDGAN
jgi:lambda repressor-like predicted transcriptional regulator